MTASAVSALLVASTALLLSACGGGSSGAIVSAPVAIRPTPAPTPTSVLPPASIGLVTDSDFNALGLGHEYRTVDGVETAPADRSQIVEIRYIPANDSYEVALPGYEQGRLQFEAYNGVIGQVAQSSTNVVTTGSSPTLQSVAITLIVPGSTHSLFTYTAYGYWDDQSQVSQARELRREGQFAYGIPTAIGDVPLSGSSRYEANVFGYTENGNYVGGTAALSFDFASGVLNGSMSAGVTDGWDPLIEPFTYTFRDTVYSSGGTAFSGGFAIPGLPNASAYFEGSFNGPQAAELMARWQAPYLFEGAEVSMFGIWVGKKQ